MQGDVFHVYAYSVSHPDVIFEARCVMESSKLGSDYYIEELVAEQYKALVDEQLRNFGYDYYIDSWCADIDPYGTPITDTSMTVEEYIFLSEHRPQIEIYITNDVLAEDNETLYALLKDITSVADCSLGFYVVTIDDLEMIKENYTFRSREAPSLSEYLNKRYSITRSYGENKKGYFGFASTDGEWNRTEEDFYTTMEEIRNNELFK